MFVPFDYFPELLRKISPTNNFSQFIVPFKVQFIVRLSINGTVKECLLMVCFRID